MTFSVCVLNQIISNIQMNLPNLSIVSREDFKGKASDTIRT